MTDGPTRHGGFSVCGGWRPAGRQDEQRLSAGGRVSPAGEGPRQAVARDGLWADPALVQVLGPAESSATCGRVEKCKRNYF